MAHPSSAHHVRVRRLRRTLSALAAASVLAVNGCGGATSDTVTAPVSLSGTWATSSSAGQTTLRLQLVEVGGTVTGTGTLGTPPIMPVTGSSTPPYTGDTFTITSGSYASQVVSFTASLGSNPVGDGTFYHGTLTFTGTVSGATMTGSVGFSPPRTATQVFINQAAVGVTLSKQ